VASHAHGACVAGGQRSSRPQHLGPGATWASAAGLHAHRQVPHTGPCSARQRAQVQVQGAAGCPRSSTPPPKATCARAGPRPRPRPLPLSHLASDCAALMRSWNASLAAAASAADTPAALLSSAFFLRPGMVGANCRGVGWGVRGWLQQERGWGVLQPGGLEAGWALQDKAAEGACAPACA
jgi:hypothetical protein